MTSPLKSNKKTFGFLTLVIFTCFLSGCGFHLVRTIPAKHPIYIQLESDQPNSRFTETLILTLKDNNIHQQEQKDDETKFFVLVGPVENKQFISALSGNTLAGTYTDSYQVTVTFVPLSSDSKKSDIKPEVTRTFVYQSNYQSNASLALSSESQISQIRRNAYPNLASQIVRNLIDMSQEKSQ
jgi:outer membrane lipopolysaccharide assembly protein LptE/RlpB